MARLNLIGNSLSALMQITMQKPFYSTLFVTKRCNSRCMFCNASNNKSRIPPLEEIKRIIDECRDFGICAMTITGGEPMLRPDIFEILKYIESRGIVYSMVTNGTLWDEDKINEIRKRKIYTLSFSLDTLDRKKYRRIRGIDGLPLLKSTLELAAEKNMRHGFVSTLTTVNELNINEVFDIVEFDRRNKFRFTCAPVSHGQNFKFRADSGAHSLNSKSAGNVSGLFNKLAEQCKKDRTIIGPSVYYRNISSFFEGNYSVPCDAGKYYISIGHDGGVSACQDFPEFGNILKDGLKKALENRTQEQMIKACAKNNPCFYGCTTFFSMLLRQPLLEKFSSIAEESWKGLLL